MTVSVPFQQSFTWRKLGYLYFSNSLDYRQVLEENPQWRVTELPPLGAQLRLSSQSEKAGRLPGGTTQGSFITGLPTAQSRLAVYPYEDEETYSTALSRYTLQGVIDRETINGITFDSVQAITGQQ